MPSSSSLPHCALLVSDFKSKNIPAFNKGEKEYELSAAAPNLVYRFTQPGCVVQPETTEQVQYIVDQAKDVGENITVKCGGHSYSGFSHPEGGVMMDLKRMTGVKLQLDKEKKPVYVKIQGGARWGDVYRTLINGAHRGYVINGGRCPPVGVGGFLLGGGLGPFTRSFGMGSDTLVEATIVTANGRKVVVSEDDEPESPEGKLFWALRGAGCGAFGVVTDFRLKVQKLHLETVVAGRYVWSPEKLDDNFRATMVKFYNTDWPDDMTIDSNWMFDVKDGKGKLGIRFTIYYNGGIDKFKEIINDNIRHPVLKEQIIRRCLPESSTQFLHESLALMWEEEIRDSIPRPGETAYQKYNSFCFRKNEGIETIMKIITNLTESFQGQFTGDTASLSFTFIHAGGAAVFKDDTAYPWRTCHFHMYTTVKWNDKWLDGIATDFLHVVKKILRPFSIGRYASFINFSDSTLSGRQHNRAYYGDNYREIDQVKVEWDKDNYFNYPWDNINKPPPGTTSRDRINALVDKCVSDLGLKVVDDVEGEEDWDDAATEVDSNELKDKWPKDWDSYLVSAIGTAILGIPGLVDFAAAAAQAQGAANV